MAIPFAGATLLERWSLFQERNSITLRARRSFCHVKQNSYSLFDTARRAARGAACETVWLKTGAS
jgi:hypothetical protein